MKKFELTYIITGKEDFIADYKVLLNGKELDSLYKKDFIKTVIDRVGSFSYSFYDSVLTIIVPSGLTKEFTWTGYKFHPEKGKEQFFKEIEDIVNKVKEIEEWQFEVMSVTTTYKYKGE